MIMITINKFCLCVYILALFSVHLFTYTFIYSFALLCFALFLLHCHVSFHPSSFFYFFNFVFKFTSCKIVTFPIMYLSSIRGIDIFPFVSACTYISTYISITDLVLCLVSIYLFPVVHSLRPLAMLLIHYVSSFIFDTND